MRKFSFIVILSVLTSLIFVNVAQAGFGISPPYVSNDKLNRGSHYEQKITLSRGNPDEDLRAEVIIEDSEIKNWINIDPGTEFLLPKGQQQVPMIVKVNVPSNAEYKNYKGIIRVRTTPVNRPKDVQVNIVLGARIDIDLTVSKEVYINFIVKIITIPDVLLKKWPFNYNNQIKVLSKIENLGNVLGAPSKITLDIYDLNEKGILESSVVSKIKKIKPFNTEQTTTFFPTKLLIGQYWAKIRIYSGQDVKYSDKIIFTVKNSSWSTKEYLILTFSAILIVILLVLISVNIFKRRR